MTGHHHETHFDIELVLQVQKSALHDHIIPSLPSLVQTQSMSMQQDAGDILFPVKLLSAYTQTPSFWEYSSSIGNRVHSCVYTHARLMGEAPRHNAQRQP